MALTHTASLTLANGATEIDAWDRYTLSLSMLRAAQPWTFSIWRSTARNTTWRLLHERVRLFDRVTVALDGHPQITGRLETFERHAQGHDECVAILSGRDLGGVAESWDADPTVNLRGLPLDEALDAIFTPLGLTLRVTPAAAAREVQGARRPGARGAGTQRRRRPIDTAHPRPGEKVWQLAQTMVRRLGYMIWVAPREDGTVGVVVDAPDYDQQPLYVLERRLSERGVGSGNILGGAEQMSVQSTPSDATIYTGSARGSAVSSKSRIVTQNTRLFDAAVTRGLVLDTLQPQPRHIRSDRARTREAAAREGERVIAEGMQDFRRYTCEVQGHGQVVQGQMRLYAVNTMARVRDDLMPDAADRPLDEDMLITDVVFEGSRAGGTKTRLTLVPKNSFVVTPDE